MKNSTVPYWVRAALIAAAYAALTFLASLSGLAFGSVQFRFSEALTILPVFTTSAIPGLTVGCFLANLQSPLGPIDWIFGSAATFIAAFLTWKLKNVTFKSVPILSPLPPVLVNALIIGFEIALIGDGVGAIGSSFSFMFFLESFLSVGLGQLIICYGLGLPLYTAIKKTELVRLFDNNA